MLLPYNNLLVIGFIYSVLLLIFCSLVWLASQLPSAAGTTLAPISSAPVFFDICDSSDGQQGTDPPITNYTQLLIVQSHLKNVAEAASGYGLFYNILKVEVAMTDLVAQVRMSDLGDKMDLAANMEVFTREAQDAGRGLHHLGSRIGSAINQ